MGITFHCEYCGKKIQAPNEAGGKWGKCPACSHKLYVPASDVGDTAATDPDVLAVWKWNDERNWRVLPKFSVDLNAAFAAAGKVELFSEDKFSAVLKQYPAAEELWCVAWEDDAAQDGYQAVHKDTPALAICAAILFYNLALRVFPFLPGVVDETR